MNERLARIWPRWGSRRFRIAFHAILFGVIAGAINLLLPLEDFVINVRSELTKRDAPQDIVVVGVDDRTLAALRTDDVSRADDAQLIRKLAAAGASRIYFDRRFRFEKDVKADDQFIEAMKENEGKVYLLVGASHDAKKDTPLSLLPAPRLREHAELVGVSGLFHPFDLMLSFPVRWNTVAGPVPSMSASLADRTGATPRPRLLEAVSNQDNGFFRTDYSFDYQSVPTISYIDVMEGRFDPQQVAGRKVVVGLLSETFKDVFNLTFEGAVPGVYFHVLGAHSMRKPFLLNLGWVPALLLVSLIIVSGMRRGRAFDRYRIAGLILVFAYVPYALGRIGIEVEIMPAVLTAGIAIIRSRLLDRFEQVTETNVASGLPSLQMLRSLPQTGPGSLIALKVRNYAAIVGSFENPVEEKLAKEMARRIRLGDPDATVYHEGDKFLWICQIENALDIFDHLEGLHRLVQTGIQVEGREIDLSFNCGVERDRSLLIDKRVANAIQATEQAARNDELVCVYDSASKDAHWEISLLSALDRAIDNGEVWVAYQPKLDLRSGRIKGAEALARWTHPERGPISPDKFIQIAEEYHRIDRITRFVLDDAVQTAKMMRAIEPVFSVSVNISAQLLRYAGLPGMILDALAKEKMPPDCIVLEITETDRLDRSSKTFDMMGRLVESGLELSIDDFGTGNATIDYLRFLPASEVKIDKVFVSGLSDSRQDSLLVESIIQMAHSLDRRIVAEGVEDERIMQILTDLGCDQVQGYHISRPIKSSELFTMLTREKATATG